MEGAQYNGQTQKEGRGKSKRKKVVNLSNGITNKYSGISSFFGSFWSGELGWTEQETINRSNVQRNECRIHIPTYLQINVCYVIFYR